jgi:hypothetical protein
MTSGRRVIPRDVSPREAVRAAIALALSAVLWHCSGEAAPVAVRYPEGTIRGFLVLRSTTGDVLAHGELIQTAHRDRVESRLVFRFHDGSLHDETVVFSQQRVFGVLTYRLLQNGPSFPFTDVSFDRRSGQYRARLREKPDKAEEVHEGRIDMPDDVYNGMAPIIVKNLAGETASAHMVAFTPKARLVKMELIPAGEDGFFLGDTPRKATKFHVKLELGRIIGVVASLLGKSPPDLYYWIADGQAPVFVKFEGPFFLNGPVWRIELTAPRWPR